MAPDVDFTLTDENFKSLEQTLSGQGIKICPKSRETVEDLEKGGISHVRTSGILVFRECEFIYHIFENAEGYRLTVDAFTNHRSLGAALVGVLMDAYPQPEPGFPSLPLPTRKLDKSRVVSNVGCICVWLFIGAVCFFCVLGIRGLFK